MNHNISHEKNDLTPLLHKNKLRLCKNMDLLVIFNLIGKKIFVEF
jgi:hypothetical protein